MGVQLPRNSRELLSQRGVSAVRRATRASVSLWWLVALVALLLSLVPMARSGGVGAALGVLPWLMAPLLAVVGWAHAAERAESWARAAFWTFEGAAAAGLVAYLVTVYRIPVLGADVAVAAGSLLLAAYVAMALGAGLVLGGRRERLWSPRLATDFSLVVVAGVAASLRLVVEPMVEAGSIGAPGITALTLLQNLAVIPVFLATLVVLRRGSALSPWAGSLLLAATLALALAGPLADPDGGVDLGAGAGLLGLAGWLLFAAAGFSARRVPATTRVMMARRRTPEAVRRLVVPGAALFLAVAVVDIGLGRPPRPETVAAVALLGIVLAIRTVQAFSIVDRDDQQRRLLAHTRALVDVTHALAGTTELDETLRVISESARSVFGTRGAGIELLTDDGETLETRSAVGLPGGVVGLRFPLEGSFTGWVVRHKEPRATVDPSRDPYIQPQSLSFLGRWPVAAAPIMFRGQTLGAVFACIRSEPFDAEELELMGALAEQAAIGIQNARLFEQVTVLSITDPLTGLANRRQLERELAREFAAARRGRPLAAVMFDLDDFKKYNDSNGHLAGDHALQAFAGSLAEETRAMNLAARYGGDEFVVILSDIDREGAETFIERVRIRFLGEVEELGNGPLTVSAGLAEFAPDMDGPDALLQAADAELYRTKARSRS